MNFEKLELLVKKVEAASCIINELKSRENLYKTQINELSLKLDSTLKQNAELKDENSKISNIMKETELLHKDLEDRIIKLIDKLPDFDNFEETTIPETVTDNLDVKSEEELSDSVNAGNDFDEKCETIFDSFSPQADNDESKDEVLENKIEEPIVDSISQTQSEVIEDAALFNLPHFETDEEDFNYDNMFAFDDIADNDDDEEKLPDYDEGVIPKGVL